jgi:hypothetical protein
VPKVNDHGQPTNKNKGEKMINKRPARKFNHQNPKCCIFAKTKNCTYYLNTAVEEVISNGKY